MKKKSSSFFIQLEIKLLIELSKQPLTAVFINVLTFLSIYIFPSMFAFTILRIKAELVF